VDALTVGAAAKSTGWSARMLRYLEEAGLIVPARSPSGYRQYGLRELNRLRSLRELRRVFGVELSDLAFAARLRRERALRDEVESWLAGADVHATDWVEWDQRKHERLISAA
jgi:MerR family copper efflux transcriptional regulator